METEKQGRDVVRAEGGGADTVVWTEEAKDLVRYIISGVKAYAEKEARRYSAVDPARPAQGVVPVGIADIERALTEVEYAWSEHSCETDEEREKRLSVINRYIDEHGEDAYDDF